MLQIEHVPETDMLCKEYAKRRRTSSYDPSKVTCPPAYELIGYKTKHLLLSRAHSMIYYSERLMSGSLCPYIAIR